MDFSINIPINYDILGQFKKGLEPEESENRPEDLSQQSGAAAAGRRFPGKRQG
jgi:hypothetical protein